MPADGAAIKYEAKIFRFSSKREFAFASGFARFEAFFEGGDVLRNIFGARARQREGSETGGSAGSAEVLRKRDRRRRIAWATSSIVLGLSWWPGLSVSFAGNPQAVMPSGLPVQVKPTFQEPYGPSFSFPQGGTTDTGAVTGATDTSSTTGGYSGTGSGVAGATVATDYSSMLGQSVGSGQCVALVQATSDVGLTSTWTPGDVVQGNTNLAAGTVIATFGSDGTYTNTVGQSHAAIYLGQDATGIIVEDQWSGQVATQRHINWTTTNSYESGSKFYVVSHA